ncbi:hypothetical protein FRC03_011197 [Tulasnella sp. 419]|nr:hypothetical protein FRC03_011197 [Tulasnella sp. 419]
MDINSRVESQSSTNYPPHPQSHPSGYLLADIDDERIGSDGVENKTGSGRRMHPAEHFSMEPVQTGLDSQLPTDTPHTNIHKREYSTSALPLVNKSYDTGVDRGDQGTSALAGRRPYSPYEPHHPPQPSSGGFFSWERIKMSTTGRKGQSRALQLTWSYAPDWILTIGITAAFYLLDSVDGFKREFDLNDTSIQHTYVSYPYYCLFAMFQRLTRPSFFGS